jgi:hypothetical protein
MPRVHYAVQVLEEGRTRSNQKWKTVFSHRNRTVAETVLASVRRDRIKVASLSRLRPIIRVPAQSSAEATAV